VARCCAAEADHWVTPEGVQIPYADVFRIDKRKWEHKGLAYAWYRTPAGAEKRAVIDDLKFGGADQDAGAFAQPFQR
jgi:hypothetical protein